MKYIVIFFLVLSNFCYSQINFIEWVDTLSSSYFLGRGPSMSGDSLAAEYIAEVFQEYDLSVEKQSFKDDVVLIDEEPVLTFDSNAEFEFGNDFVVNPSSKPGAYKAKPIIITDNANCPAMGKCWKNKAVVISTKKMNLLITQGTFQEKFAEARMIIELVKGVPVSNMAQSNLNTPHVRLRTRSFSSAKKISLTVKSHVENRAFYNVIGRLEGTTDKTVIICAHYDHLGKVGNVMFPGANDNASGVAMLFSLIHDYKKRGEKPNVNLVIIAFGAEEVGLLGSRFYTNNPVIPLDSIEFVFNLDLLGAGSEGLMIQNALEQKDAYELLLKINGEQSYFEKLKSRANAANSDHWPFSEKGIPAIFLYSLGDVGGYHNQYDTVNQLEKNGDDVKIRNLILEFISKY